MSSSFLTHFFMFEVGQMLGVVTGLIISGVWIRK